MTRMLPVRRLLVAGTLLLSAFSSAQAAILYESGTLGPAGVAYSEILSGATPSASIDQFGFTGVRFQLTQSVVTTQVGGHFVSESGGTFFGAIVALTGPTDFPDSANLSTPDVLGTTQISFPNPSAQVFGDLSLTLSPAWYALAFGSGLFGAHGNGSAPSNNPDIGAPSYIRFDPNLQWFDLNIFPPPIAIVDFRFVVLGHAVPEPGSWILATLAAFGVHRRLFREVH